MLPLLKVSPCRPPRGNALLRLINVHLGPSAPRRRMHTVEPFSERSAHSTLGRGQRTLEDRWVSFKTLVAEPRSLTPYSWSGIYKGNNGSEAVVRRFVATCRVVTY